MSFTTLLLLLGASFLHVGAHVGYKRATNKLAFMWWWLLAVAVLFGPVLWPLRGYWQRPAWSPTVWIILVTSALVEAAYMVSTSLAYAHSDLSVAYPLSRGSAPLFIALWAGLFLGERPSLAGWLGIGAIVAGLYLLNLRAPDDLLRPLRSLQHAGSRWALLQRVCISIYSTVDKVGVRYLPPLPYLYLVLLVTWSVLTPVCWLGLRREVMTHEWRVGKWAALLTGVMVMMAYMLVLTAMQSSHVSYVGAVREISVVLGAWVGSVWLHEGQAASRVPASVLVATGIILIAAAG